MGDHPTAGRATPPPHTPPPHTPPPHTPPPHPVGFVATLALAMGVGPLLVHGLTALSPLVVADLGLSRTQFGTFATTAYLAAALTSSSVGVLVDRMSERRTMTILFAGSVLALWAAAAAPAYGWLVVVVVFSGVIQALSNPITNRLIAAVPDVGGRGTMMGIKQAGVQMVQAFAGLVLPGLALWATWRGALATASALALAGLVLSARYIRDTERAPTAARRPARPGRLPTAVWWLAVFAFLSGASLQAVNVYLPLYGYEALGLPSTAAGALTAVVGILGLLGRIVWGRVVGRTSAPRAALLVLAAGAVVGIGLTLLAVDVHPALVWAGAAIFGATGLAANVVLMVTVLRVVPAGFVGRATGALAMGLYLGFAVGPVSFGALVDATGDYRVGWAAALALFVVAGVLALARREWVPPQPEQSE